MKNLRIEPEELMLWLLPFVLFAPGIFGGKAFFWGTTLLQFIPWRHLALELLRQGEFPLWNPFSGMGAPLLANYQSALLYPPTWALLALEALGGLEWSAIGQGVLLAVHLGFGAVGMKRWLSAIGIQGLGQVVGGMAFGLGGYVVSRASFQSIAFSAVWMPWILFLAHRLVWAEGRTLGRSFFWLVAAIALNLLAGHAQTSWYILWTATAWVLWQSLWMVKEKRRSWWWVGWKLLLWAGAILWAAGVAAAQLLPTGEYLLNSQRSGGIDREIGLTYSFWPWRFLTIFMPNLFGNPAQGNYWGYANYWEDAMYSGAMALPLAMFAWWRAALQRRDRETWAGEQVKLGRVSWFWWSIAILAMILALGKNLPFYPWLLEYIPGFDLFQAPTRISLIAQFGLSTLAAMGIDLWEAPQGRVLYWTRLGTAGFFSMFLVSSFVSFQMGEFYPTISQSVWQFGLLGCLFGLILLARPPDSVTGVSEARSRLVLSPTVWKVVLFLFWAGDLLWMGRGLNPVLSRELYRARFTEEKEAPANSRYFMHPDDEYTLKFEKFFRFDTFQHLVDWAALRNSMLPNLNLLDRRAMINNFDPLLPARFAAWVDALSEARRNGQEEVYRRLLVKSAATYLIELHNEQVVVEPLKGGKRFQFFPCAEIASTADEALRTTLSQAARGLDGVVIETNRLREKACRGNSHAGFWSVWVLSETAHSIRIEVVSPQRGWLIMRDTFYPGWVAKVNGKEEKVFPADSVFRAVPVEAGRSHIELYYRPHSWTLGINLSLVSIIGLFLLRGYMNK